MKVAVLVNSGSGTVRAVGSREVEGILKESLVSPLWNVQIEMIEGPRIPARLKELVSKEGADIIVAGGGDGTISSIAGLVKGSQVVLGVLPLGTMNLFAKALGLSQNLAEAAKQLATSQIAEIDVGVVNDRTFLHQLSLGMQPRMVRLREKMGYSSRWTKMLGSVKAFLRLMRRPRNLNVHLDTDDLSRKVKASAVVISNNVYGDTLLPYQQKLDDGILGIYVFKPVGWRPTIGLIGRALVGRWKTSAEVDVLTAGKVGIRSKKGKSKSHVVSIDGEIERLKFPIFAQIEPKALRVLVPREKAPQSPLPSTDHESRLQS